jgi:hypothetical protein
VADGLIPRQEQRFIEFAQKEGGVVRLDLKHRPAPPALREQNPRNVEKRIDPGHLVNLTTYQMNRLWVRIQGHADALRGPCVLDLWRAFAAVSIDFPAALGGPALIAITGPAVTLATPRLTLAASGIGLGPRLESLRVVGGARPGWSQGKF